MLPDASLQYIKYPILLFFAFENDELNYFLKLNLRNGGQHQSAARE